MLSKILIAILVLITGVALLAAWNHYDVQARGNGPLTGLERIDAILSVFSRDANADDTRGGQMRLDHGLGDGLAFRRPYPSDQRTGRALPQDQRGPQANSGDPHAADPGEQR